ncbi:LuxR C-terminal-related transcriptional regulator [Actinoplanes sp. NPDC049596]|uniref:ATP-binding protein n=1 Tax=unclassified Actinoplanes TaxID=2626549 RepID=UPI00342DA28E
MTPLQGRFPERQLLETFTGTVRDGRSAALVLIGEAGIGKTRLLDHAAATAGDLRIARTAGAESESHLGFSGLHQLLRPFLDRMDRLPDPQRSALATAFGLVTASPPDLFLVGLAALTLLADAAADLPVICLVDDAHWLDRESLGVLAFLGRRLGADGLGLLIAARDEPGARAVLRGLDTHPLDGLAGDDARGLIASAAAGRLDARVAGRIAAESGGNPLALIEMTAALSPDQLAGGSVLPEFLPIGDSLEAHFARQVRLLPADTRQFLLLVAAAPPGDSAVLWRAASRLGLAPTAADEAVSQGILLPELALRHPLIRSAAYTTATPAERRAVHLALGETIEHDPGRRAWHLAESVVGLDDGVAGQLEQAAERARTRGGYATQGAFLSRAAELTSDGPLRARRFLAATRPYMLVGDIATAARRLDQATPGLDSPALKAAGQRARATIEWYSSGVAAKAPALLLDAVQRFSPLDDGTVREMLWEAMIAGLISGRHTAGVTLADIADVALKTPGPPTLAGFLLDAFAMRTVGDFDRAVPLLRDAVAAMRTGDLGASSEPLTSVGSWAALEVWDDEGFGAVLDRMDAFARGQGALHALKSTLDVVAAWRTITGRFAAAEAVHDEADQVAAAIGLPGNGVEHRLELLAWQGREAESRAAAEFTERVWATELRYGVLGNHASYATVILELGLGRYPEALAAARPLLDEDTIGIGNRVLTDVIEAGVRAGDRAAAEFAFERLSERAPASGTPWALGLLARGRALLAGDGAESHYAEAADLLGRTAVRTELARTHLVHGEWLRRRGRRTDARDQLRTAYDLFLGFGAAAFAERARVELRATGESARKRDDPAPATLTPQELQVATLAAGGATNTEIATRLFITASTVEYHLNKIFRKLGLTSRRQIAGRLGSFPGAS